MPWVIAGRTHGIRCRTVAAARLRLGAPADVHARIATDVYVVAPLRRMSPLSHSRGPYLATNREDHRAEMRDLSHSRGVIKYPSVRH
jgi:hypothetical protein